VDYARRRCGGSILGPGFESPRLHLEDDGKQNGASISEAPFCFCSAQLAVRKAQHQVHVIRPAPDIAHVLVVSECVADADHAFGLVVAVAVTVTFCDGVKPAPDPLPEK
jgi:hypothetical protein